MSALGHEQTSRHVRVMSAIPLKAVIRRRVQRVCFVPIADLRSRGDNLPLGVPSTSILNEGNSPRVRTERLVAQSSPVWMAVVVFAATYLLTASIYWVVTTLAVNDRARAFKALSPGMLSPLGILFALLVGFIAVEVWSNFDKAKAAVATEASALRAVVVLAGTFPEEQKTRIYALIDRHIEEAINKEWHGVGATASDPLDLARRSGRGTARHAQFRGCR